MSDEEEDRLARIEEDVRFLREDVEKKREIELARINAEIDAIERKMAFERSFAESCIPFPEELIWREGPPSWGERLFKWYFARGV